jgi:hypothetical protein
MATDDLLNALIEIEGYTGMRIQEILGLVAMRDRGASIQQPGGSRFGGIRAFWRFSGAATRVRRVSGSSPAPPISQ